jgi:hypothetical protein
LLAMLIKRKLKIRFPYIIQPPDNKCAVGISNKALTEKAVSSEHERADS